MLEAGQAWGVLLALDGWGRETPWSTLEPVCDPKVDRDWSEGAPPPLPSRPMARWLSWRPVSTASSLFVR
jgi:hypothetical protein